LSAFNEMGLISVDQREICLLDTPTLKTLRRLPPAKTRSKVSDKVSALVGKKLMPQWSTEAAVAA